MWIKTSDGRFINTDCVEAIAPAVLNTGDTTITYILRLKSGLTSTVEVASDKVPAFEKYLEQLLNSSSIDEFSE